MKKLIILLIVVSCTLEVPVDEIEIPPIENHTTIVVNMPDGMTLPTGEEEASDVQTAEEKQCEYQHFPDYYNHYGAFVLGCTGDVDNSDDFVCCTWVFPEDRQACEERWCRDSDNTCGWALNSWQCYSY